MAPTHCAESGKFEETVDHLVSGCPELSKTEYKTQYGLQHISTGQYATTMTSKYKINTINMN